MSSITGKPEFGSDEPEERPATLNLSVKQIALGVFLGNLLMSALGLIVYWIIRALS